VFFLYAKIPERYALWYLLYSIPSFKLSASFPRISTNA
jgi:hypothetical protein